MLWVLARFSFAGIFVFSGLKHFIQREVMVIKVMQHGVWFPETAHFIAGLLCFAAGILLLMGKTRWGLYALWLFLIPTTLLMHRFWELDDPIAAQEQLTQFLKNLSILGGSFFLLRAQKDQGNG